MMKDIERYFTAAEYVHQNVTSDIINLAIVYDFMSYAALTIRDTISSGRTVAQSKNSIKFTLSQYEESPTHSHHGQFHRAFRAIVDNIKTAEDDSHAVTYCVQPDECTTTRGYDV